MALIPIWIDKNSSASFKKLPDRPVLIQVATLGAILYGQIIRFSPYGARVVPNDPILLRGNVDIKVLFRVADTEYILSGVTLNNDVDNSILFDFDSVTRKRIIVLSGQLKDDSLHQACEEAVAAQKEAINKAAEKPRVRPTKAELRRVRREAPPGGIERRVHSRHELKAVTTLIVVDKEVVLKCQLLEISRSGCRIFSDVPPRLEQNTPVEVDFVGNGYPLRIAAIVKVKTDEFLLGLEFQKMSHRTTERLNELLNELKQQCPQL